MYTSSLPPLRTSRLFFLSIAPPPPRSTLFPYTTLFRSRATRFLAISQRKDAPTSLLTYFISRISGGSARHRSHPRRSEEHTSELQSHVNLVCRLLLEKKNSIDVTPTIHINTPRLRRHPY